MKLNENEVFGLVKDEKGNSRFVIKIAENTEMLCFLRKKVKSNYKRSKNRLRINDYVVVYIEPGFSVGNIIKKLSDETDIAFASNLCNFELYEIQ